MIRTLLSALTVLIWANGAFAAECRDNAVLLRGDWGQARFNIDVVDDERSRAIGLMHRQSMPQSYGMLFVYEHPQELNFWMRNTLIPLDMLFVDSTGVVTYIHENAVPHDETGISGGRGLAVLEINGGMARAMGITVGSQLRHPAFDPAIAAWSC
jgi:uncharacterized membrane protein (UPF0127 family)